MNEAGEIINQRGGGTQEANAQTSRAPETSTQNTLHHQVGQHTVQVHAEPAPREKRLSGTETATTTTLTNPTVGSATTTPATTQSTASVAATSTTTSTITPITSMTSEASAIPPSAQTSAPKETAVPPATVDPGTQPQQLDSETANTSVTLEENTSAGNKPDNTKPNVEADPDKIEEASSLDESAAVEDKRKSAATGLPLRENSKGLKNKKK